VAVASAGTYASCTSLQTDNHANTPPLKFFTGRMPFLPPNQQSQSTEGTALKAQMAKWTIFKQVAGRINKLATLLAYGCTGPDNHHADSADQN